jgi:hypothetical protein
MRPGSAVLIRILRHRPEIVLGMLEIILRCDPVSPQGFSAGQGEIGLIAFLCALSVLRLSARKPGMLVSPDGLGSWARCIGHKFRIWAWLCRYRLRFRDVFHVGPYAAPAEPCDVDWRKCRAAIQSTGHCGRRSNFERAVCVPGARLAAERARRTNPYRLRFRYVLGNRFQVAG